MHRKLSDIIKLTTAALLGLLALQSCIYDYAPDDAESDAPESIRINTMLAGSRNPRESTPVPTSEEGSGQSFMVLFWQREEFLIDPEQSSSFWLAPYLASPAPKAVTEYAELTYDTNYPYPFQETTPLYRLYATGYAPADVLKHDTNKGYNRLYVPAAPADGTDKLDRGRYDFLGCDAWNEVFQGCQNAPFAREVNKLIFHHLAAKLLFCADRDSTMQNSQFVRNVEISNLRMSIDGGTTWTPLHTPSEFKWVVYSESDKNQFSKAYTEAIKAAQTLNGVTTKPAAGYKTVASEPFSDATGFTLMRRTIDGGISLDRVPISGQRLDSCYVCNPYVNGTEQTNLPIRLKMDISAAELSYDLSFPNADEDTETVKGNTNDNVTFTRSWPDVEVKAIYETKSDGTASENTITSFRPGREYRIYLHFNRTGVNLVAREHPWNIGGLHYIGIIGSDTKPTPEPTPKPTPEPTPTAAPPLRHSTL